MRRMKLSELVADKALYPRMGISERHVEELRQAIKAGAKLPPLVICKDTRRIADGFHRKAAYEAEGIEEAEVVEKHYRNDADLFKDAMRLNAVHGLRLSTVDKSACVETGLRLGLSEGLIAESLSVSTNTIGRLKPKRANGELKTYTRVAKHVEHELIRAAKAGDNGAKEKLLAQFEGSLKQMARKACREGDDLDDLIQTARIELLDCIERYDFEWQTAFVTYLYARVPRMLERSQHIESSSIKTNPSIQHNQLDDHTYEDIKRARRVKSLNAALSEDGNTLQDGVADHRQTPEHVERVRAAVANLTGHRRAVIEGRLEGKTHQQIGDGLGISGERVRQLEESGHQELEHLLKGVDEDFAAMERLKCIARVAEIVTNELDEHDELLMQELEALHGLIERKVLANSV